MDSNKRIWVLLAVSAVALAVPYFIKPEADKQAAQQHAAKSAGNSADKGGGAASAKPAPAAAPAPAPMPAAPKLSASELAARAASQVLGQVETDSYVAKVSNLNGGLTSFALKGKHFQVAGKPLDMVTTDKEAYLPLAVELDGWPSAGSRFELTPRSPRELLLALEQDGLKVTRKLEAGRGPFQLWVTTHIENTGAAPRKVQLRHSTHHYVTREAEGSTVPLLPVRASAHSSGLCHHSDELERHEGSALIEEPQAFSAPIEFSGVENVYFLTAVAPEVNDVSGCRLSASSRGTDHVGTLFSAQLDHRAVELAPGKSASFHVLAYLGPKSPNELAAAGHSLKQAIQSGWFTTLADGLTWLLRWIYDGVGNWGLAIILLTFVVKLVLFPLTYRQMQSMGRMKELKPELDRINELYGDDREKKGAAIMELYRKRGVNPMAGCFPMLLQLPIWFSLYASLSSNVELFQAPFVLWWTDLSSPDHLFFLPLALGILMFVQQKMTPASGMDPLQQKMMLYMMPTMMTAFMLFLPAGLCLYMFTNSALSILQQRAIEARLKKASAAPAEPESAPQSSQQAQSSQPPDTLKARPERSARPSKAERRWRRGKR
jgi:YidC/Oxa1 family membrane protein insertase